MMIIINNYGNCVYTIKVVIYLHHCLNHNLNATAKLLMLNVPDLDLMVSNMATHSVLLFSVVSGLSFK